jgi:ankyrin repeat protein
MISVFVHAPLTFVVFCLVHNACFRGSPFEHIETLAMSNPQWVKCVNNAGYTALQIMCKNARLQDRVITTFSRIGGPGVFSVVDLTGNTPLHSAMREETDIDALRCLIRAYPDALHMKTNYGDTPLHLACFRRVNPEVVREVALSYNEPPLLTPNTAGQTPIGIAMEEFEGLCRQSGLCSSKSDYTPDQQKAFDVLATLVKILHYGSSPHDDRDRMGSLLLACVSLHRRDVRLDPSFIRRAMHLYPEEARISDDEGYPLHVEASIPVEKYTLLNGSCWGCCNGNAHNRLGILRMLFELYPDACKTRNNAGEFPLNLMIQNGRPWDQSFALVLRKFPQALHWSVGDSHKLFPLILSKVSKECGLATLHTLIRSRPDMAMRTPTS